MKTHNLSTTSHRSQWQNPRTVLSLLALCALAACGGGSSSTPAPTPTPAPTSTPTPTPTPGGTVSVSGRITFDRVPFAAGTNTGLDFAHTTQAPARGIVVEALDAANTSATVLASGVTDAAGYYTLAVPENTNTVIRAKAQMLATSSVATWNFKVLNNANGDALYALDSPAPFNSGTVAIANENLNAPSGWNGTTYPPSANRAAAPFAILDNVYEAVQLIVTAQPQITLPALNIFWSTANTANLSSFCAMTGAINTTAFHSGDVARANCVSQLEAAGGIYVLGDFASGNGDTDEFDTHVITHEFGHYIEHSFSRADSQGGPHGAGNKLDPRVAMSEGWGNAFSGMPSNDPIYRDSQFQNGASVGFSFDLRTSDPSGWYSEATVQNVLWSLFSAPTNLGFAPILQALQGRQRVAAAFTTIFSFLDAIETVVPASAAAITQLANASGINSSDPFAIGETNSGGDAGVLPLYNLPPATAPVCSSATNGTYNKLGNRKFFKIVTSISGLVSISLNAAASAPGTVAAKDPDFMLWSAGVLKIDGTQGITATESRSATLPAGTYVLEVYDFAYNDPSSATINNGPHCMTVTITTP